MMQSSVWQGFVRAGLAETEASIGLECLAIALRKAHDSSTARQNGMREQRELIEELTGSDGGMSLMSSFKTYTGGQDPAGGSQSWLVADRDLR